MSQQSAFSCKIFPINPESTSKSKLYWANRGGALDLANRNEIDVMINVANDVNIHSKFREGKDIEYYKYPINEVIPENGPNNRNSLFQKIELTNLNAFELIHNKLRNGKRVCVSCYAGKNRSTSIVIGFFLLAPFYNRVHQVNHQHVLQQIPLQSIKDWSNYLKSKSIPMDHTHEIFDLNSFQLNTIESLLQSLLRSK